MKINYKTLSLKFTSILLLIFLLSCSKQSKLYSCSTFRDAETCSINCTYTKSTIEFEVNKEKNMILYKIYNDGNFSGSGVKENCKIFDGKNWDCSSSTFLSNYSNEMMDRMTNGIYSDAIKSSVGDSGGICSK
jgi:hypothetical protein